MKRERPENLYTLDAFRSIGFRINLFKEKKATIVILTEWDLYRDLDYSPILESMARLVFIFDGRNILDHKKLFEMGFNVFAVGKAPFKHF